MEDKVRFSRKAEEAILKAVMGVSLAVVIFSLLSVLATVVIKGAQSLSLDMITKVPEGGYYLGRGGGILNAIVGSMYLGVGATAIALVVGFPTAVFLNEYASASVPSGRTEEKVAGFVRRSLDILWGVPSIIYGSFGFVVMVALGIRASLLGGILALALLELPIMTRAMDEVMRMAPAGIKEASFALGASRLQTTVGVVARQALPGITTAATLALGRAMGDAASVLFTAGFSDSIPTSLNDPVASLPLAIFFQLGTPFPEVQARAYASAILLLAVILTLNIGSRLIAARFSRFQIK